MAISPEDSYVIVGMLLICLVGIFGNALTLRVLLHQKHRRETMTPFMVSLAAGHLFVSLAAYPECIVAKLSGSNFYCKHRTWCSWSGFLNGTAGVAAFATNALMAIIMYRGVGQILPPRRRSAGRNALLIWGTWVYSSCANMPPLIGWNKFIPGKAGMSCAPDWTSHAPQDLAHVCVLMLLGFFIPVTVIGYCYVQVYRIVSKEKAMIRNISDTRVIRRRLRRTKMIRVMVTSAASTVLCWSPYALVSLASMFHGEHALVFGEAEVPELLAKAYAIFNPLVYTFMNARFRSTLQSTLPSCRLKALCRRAHHFPVVIGLRPIPYKSDRSSHEQTPAEEEPKREALLPKRGVPSPHASLLLLGLVAIAVPNWKTARYYYV